MGPHGASMAQAGGRLNEAGPECRCHGCMHFLIGAVFAASCLLAQVPEPKPAASVPQAPVTRPGAKADPKAGTGATTSGTPRVGPVVFDGNGWPVLQEEPGASAPPPPVAGPASTPAAPAGEARATAVPGNREPQWPATPPLGQAVDVRSARGEGAMLASGTERGSPLLDVFQHVGMPGTFKAIGGITVWWRITIYDQQGGVVGYRELTQTSDCKYPERDRLEFVDDGRVYGRFGPSVFAERQGRPRLGQTEAAAQELLLYGMHLRFPWCFGDGGTYAVVARDTVDRPEERLQRVVLERRPPASLDVVGPEFEPRPRDRFELVYEPSSGRPREFVHRLTFGGTSGQTRRVLLDEWEEFQGVPFARRRTYLDDNQRPTTLLQITNLQAATVGERDFKLR